MEPITFMSSFLTFYLKGEIKQEQNFLKLKVPNTILTFIPLGARSETIPVNQISSVDTNFKVHIKNLIIGFWVSCLGMVCLSSSVFWGLILAVLGVSICVNAFQTVLSIKTTASEAKNVHFLVFEKQKAEQAAQMILQCVSGRLDDTNVRQQNEVMTGALVDAIQSLKDKD